MVSNHIRTKLTTTNVEEIAAALKRLATEHEVPLEAPEPPEDDQLRLVSGEADDDEEIDRNPRTSKQRQITEKLDEQLKLATEPLEHLCTRIDVLDARKRPLITLGSIERAVIAEPLTLPPPKRDWVQAEVKFVRIHKQTGRAMIYFRGENEAAYGAHFSRIIDPRVKDAGNPYTTAFNNNDYLPVWARQRVAPKGRLNMQWDITGQAPATEGLLPWPEIFR